MPVILPLYAKIKDKYCIAYYGNSKEYLIQLKLLRPIMEKTFPGIAVYLSCKDECLYLLQNEERIISRTELKDKKHEFAYIRELTCDMLSHPVEEFMKESELPCGPVATNTISYNGCVLLTNGIPPVSSLTSNQIKSAIHFIKSKGCEPTLNENTKHVDWVVGVENEQLYQAAAEGKHVTLIPTGFGENIFKSMFPNCEILRIPQ